MRFGMAWCTMLRGNQEEEEGEEEGEEDRVLCKGREGKARQDKVKYFKTHLGRVIVVGPRPLPQVLGEELQRRAVAALDLDAGPAAGAVPEPVRVHEEVVRWSLEKVVGSRDRVYGGEDVDCWSGLDGGAGMGVGLGRGGGWMRGFDYACCPGLGV